jgi:hypothetical protein
MKDADMSDASARGATPSSDEARCDRCSETFHVAPGHVDLLHFQRRNGELCGGEGIPFRKYVIRNPNRI